MIVYATKAGLQVLERRQQGLIRDGRIFCLNKVPFAAWAARLSQLVPNASTELVVEYDQEIGAILVLHRLRRKSIPSITPEEMPAALAREREMFTKRRTIELAKANEALHGCLDALAAVPNLDEFLGQVMAAMQLGVAQEELASNKGDPLCRIQRAVELANLGLAEARRSAHNLRFSIVHQSELSAMLQGLVERSSFFK